MKLKKYMKFFFNCLPLITCFLVNKYDVHLKIELWISFSKFVQVLVYVGLISFILKV
jgi:hypothetical protein